MLKETDVPKEAISGWRRSLAAYTDRHVLQVLALGFSSGLPLMLTYLTLSAWLATAGVKRSAIGAFALVSSFYALKFLWSPLIDRLPPPFPLGRRRGWGLTIQIPLVAAILALGMCDPKRNLGAMAALAAVVAFLSASQDIVIDAWRIEILPLDLQGPGAATTQTGYYLGMLASGAGALAIAARFSWFAAYVTMAALMVVGMLTFLLGPEPIVSEKTSERDRIRFLTRHQRHGWKAVEDWLSTAVIGPFADFMHRKSWFLVLLVILDYKLGEGMAAVMSTPLYISLHFSLNEIAVVSKLFGPIPVIVGAILGGLIPCALDCSLPDSLRCFTRAGKPHLRAPGRQRTQDRLSCALRHGPKSHLRLGWHCLISYISSLCSPEFTATQYALFASLALLGRTFIGSTGGALSESIGWVPFFVLTTVASLPAILLLLWIERRSAGQTNRADPVSSLAH